MVMDALEERWEERGQWAMHIATRIHPWPQAGDDTEPDNSDDLAAIQRIYTAWLYIVTGVENLRIQLYPREPDNREGECSRGGLRPLVVCNDDPAEYVIQLPEWISTQARWDLISQAARLVWELEGSPPAPETEMSNS